MSGVLQVNGLPHKDTAVCLTYDLLAEYRATPQQPIARDYVSTYARHIYKAISYKVPIPVVTVQTS